jgi:hypothetical protein
MTKAEAKRKVFKINVAPKQWVVVNQGNHSATMDYYQACARVREIRAELEKGEYMHAWTGALDTREGWIDSIEPMELAESGFDTAEELFESYVESGAIVRV